MTTGPDTPPGRPPGSARQPHDPADEEPTMTHSLPGAAGRAHPRRAHASRVQTGRAQTGGRADPHRADRARTGRPAPGQPASRRIPRVGYILAVALFAASFTPSAVDSFTGATAATGGTGGTRSVALTVLCAAGLAIFGAISGVVGSIVLDVLLMLALRVAGADPTLRQASRQLDGALAPLAAGVVAAAIFVLAQGAAGAFASPVVSAVMALAVVAHCAMLLLHLQPVLGRSVGRRLAALACYVAVPAGVIVAAQAVGGA